MAKKSKRILITVILLLLAAVLAGLAYMKAKEKPKGQAIEFVESEIRTIKETVSGSGRIFPEKEVKISSDVSGEIVALYVAEGDSVVAGQLLAKIDPDAYLSSVERGEAALNNAKASESMSKAQIESARAQKEQILANLSNAKTIHERNTSLKEEGVISQVEFDQSLATLKGLEANLRAAEASLRSAEESAKGSGFNVSSSVASLKELKTNLSRTTIKAPVSGIVSSLSVEQGERVVGTIQMQGTEMMRIANLSTMETQVEISENDILKVSVGDTADIEVDAYLDKTFYGVVTEIANSAANISSTAGASLSSDQVTNFIVKIRLDSDSYNKVTGTAYPFRPGMSASVDIYTNSLEDVVSIPIQSVTTRKKNEDDDELKEVVFIYNADTVAMVDVFTGIQNDEFIHVVSGVEEGQKVVSAPYSAISKKLEDGSLVREKEKKDDKKEDE
jgi:HlyD family secretion protein